MDSEYALKITHLKKGGILGLRSRRAPAWRKVFLGGTAEHRQRHAGPVRAGGSAGCQTGPSSTYLAGADVPEADRLARWQVRTTASLHEARLGEVDRAPCRRYVLCGELDRIGGVKERREHAQESD